MVLCSLQFSQHLISCWFLPVAQMLTYFTCPNKLSFCLEYWSYNTISVKSEGTKKCIAQAPSGKGDKKGTETPSWAAAYWYPAPVLFRETIWCMFWNIWPLTLYYLVKLIQKTPCVSVYILHLDVQKVSLNISQSLNTVQPLPRSTDELRDDFR